LPASAVPEESFSVTVTFAELTPSAATDVGSAATLDEVEIPGGTVKVTAAVWLSVTESVVSVAV